MLTDVISKCILFRRSVGCSPWPPSPPSWKLGAGSCQLAAGSSQPPAVVPQSGPGDIDMIEHRKLSRRDALVTLGAAAGVVLTPEARASQAPLTDLVGRNDAAVEALLRTQVTDAGSAYRGGVPDQLGLHSAGSAGNVAETMTASFVDSRSRYRGDGVLLDRIRLAAGFL